MLLEGHHDFLQSDLVECIEKSALDFTKSLLVIALCSKCTEYTMLQPLFTSEAGQHPSMILLDLLFGVQHQAIETLSLE